MLLGVRTKEFVLFRCRNVDFKSFANFFQCLNAFPTLFKKREK